jgi:hypothetical protein
MMLGSHYGLLAALVLGSLASAAERKNAVQQQAEAELLALHQQDRMAHFNHETNALLAHLGRQLFDVRDGKVTVMGREDVRSKFANYFSHAEFSAWDDVQPPVVRVSNDGMMGWMIVRVRIAYTERDKSGHKTEHDSIMAWMSTYEKSHGNWIMTAVTSTSDER